MSKHSYKVFFASCFKILSQPYIILYTLPWLMLLLTIGTLSQQELGIYEAERLFFSSFILWVGPLPLPGTALVLWFIGLSLIAKIFLKSPWTLKKSGTLLTHFSVLLLLGGGAITAFFSEENFIVLAPGEQSQTVSDYHHRDFIILKNEAHLISLPYTSLQENQHISLETLPFKITLTQLSIHNSPEERRYISLDHKGLAEKFELVPKPREKDDEKNQTGLTINLTGSGPKTDGTYIVFEGAPYGTHITVGKDKYRIALRKKQRTLPFFIKLDSFKRTIHTGTNIPRSYESAITILDDGAPWHATISMNQPLHYKGYTIFQSSFVEEGSQQLSILAVVHNAGRFFPYIASALMCLGLLVHLILRPRRKKASSI